MAWYDNLVKTGNDLTKVVGGMVDAWHGTLNQDAVQAAMDNGSRSVLWVAKFVDTDSFGSLPNIMTSVSDVLVPIAVAFVLLFFILELVDVGFSERFNFEMFVKMVAKVAIALFLVQNTAGFIKAGGALSTEAGNYLATIITGFNDVSANNNSAQLAKDFCDSWNAEDHNFFDTEIALTGLTLAAATGKIVSLFVLTVLISRQLEIIVRGSFMSIAVAFIAENQNRQAGIRYIKQFIALYLQGPAIMICFGLYSAIAGAISGNVASAMCSSGDLVGCCLAVMACPLCCGLGLLGAIKSTKPICEAAMGV